MSSREAILGISLWLCCFVPSGLQADDIPDFNIRLWQVEEGLPHNIVQAIAQTRDSYLWVGTREGVARFDGDHFQKLTLPLGGLNPSILSLLGSKDGSLWVGTEKFGLLRLYAGQIERYALPNGSNNFDVKGILEGADGGIWVSAPPKILRLENGKLVQKAISNVLWPSIYADKKGRIWEISGALRWLDGDTPKKQVLYANLLPSIPRSIYCDCDDVIWIGTDDNLIELKDGVIQRFQRVNEPLGFVSAILRDSENNLWLGSYSGLSRFMDGKFVNLHKSDEPAYRIYTIYEDRERNLWVGSEEGLTRLTSKTFRTITKKDGLPLNTVVTVCPSRDGSVWFSTWGGGLNHWVDGKITNLQMTNGLSSNFIMALTEGHDGSLWAGTDFSGALNRIKDGQVTIYGKPQGFVSPYAVTALYEDKQGTLWIGGRESLQCWDGKKFTSFGNMANKKVNALCGGIDATVWIGTDSGLMRWHDGQFEDLATDNARLNVSILSLYEDGDNILWIGTRLYGLLRWEKRCLAKFSSDQGMFSDSIYSILEDNHTNLWLDSSRGIFRVRKRQIKDVTEGRETSLSSISYGKADGILISGQFQEVTQPAACKSQDGRFWFRTTQGIAVVDPEKITTNPLPPPVEIQEIIADQKVIVNSMQKPVPEKIIIQPGRGELQISYAALSLKASEKNKFRYKLEGIDASWVDGGNRRVAYYTNLRPGQYCFRVTACNNDELWNDTGASVVLVIEPHFWQTGWFLFAVVAGVVGAAGGITRYITHQRMQRRLHQLEQQNSLEKERARIARDMHDELGAKLTRISFQGATARRRMRNPAEVEQQIMNMSETARQLVLSLDQIVWAVDPQNDTLENTVNYICRYASEFVENSPLRCEFIIPTKLPDHRLSTDVRHNVFLAVKEVLNNVFKHAHAEKITLKISTHAHELEISISDDGCGMDLNLDEKTEIGRFKRTGHGMINLRERLAAINGRFEIKSESRCGTEVRLLVPLPTREP